MLQPGYDYWSQVADYPGFACDTGCYAQGERFDVEHYLRWLDEHREHGGRCLFATAPDVFGDAAATWERSRDVLPEIRRLGYPAALVAQDGWDGSAVDWSAFDCLFVGGTTRFKLSESARKAVAEARARGLWTHVGRVNSLRRLRVCQAWGVDSADGTFLAFGSDANLPRVLRWVAALQLQPQLALEV